LDPRYANVDEDETITGLWTFQDVNTEWEAPDADSINTTRKSPAIDFIGKYWDGTKSEVAGHIFLENFVFSPSFGNVAFRVRIGNPPYEELFKWSTSELITISDIYPTYDRAQDIGSAEELRRWRRVSCEFVNLHERTTDPTLSAIKKDEGLIWFREDLGLLSYSPDASIVRRLPYGDDTYDLYADTIAEKTTGAGVTVDGALLKDNDVIVDEVYLDKANQDVRLYRVGIDELGLADQLSILGRTDLNALVIGSPTEEGGDIKVYGTLGYPTFVFDADKVSLTLKELGKKTAGSIQFIIESTYSSMEIYETNRVGRVFTQTTPSATAFRLDSPTWNRDLRVTLPKTGVLNLWFMDLVEQNTEIGLRVVKDDIMLDLGGGVSEAGDIRVSKESGVNQFYLDADAEENVDALRLYGRLRVGVTKPVRLDGSIGNIETDNVSESTSGAGITFKHTTRLDNVDEIFEALDADATNTTRDSPSVILRGKYWDGATSVNRDAEIFHDIIDTVPTSQIAVEVPSGTRILNIRDDGLYVPTKTLAVGKKPDSTKLIDLWKNFTVTGWVHGLRSIAVNSVDNPTGGPTAVEFTARARQGATESIYEVRGCYGSAQVATNGTITNLIGMLGWIFVADGYTPTITNAYGVRVGKGRIFDATLTNYYGIQVLDSAVDTGAVTRTYGLYVKEQTMASTNWCALFEGDVQICSDKKLILEGSGTVKGDTYIVFNSAQNRIEFYLNGVLEGWIDTTGFVSA